MPDLVLGRDNLRRYLRRSGEYGKLDLHSHSWVSKRQGISGSGEAAWNEHVFGRRCAGCHTTGVDPKTNAFSSPSIDCYACHGDVDLNHSTDSSKMLLASTSRHERLPKTSASCATCHESRDGKWTTRKY